MFTRGNEETPRSIQRLPALYLTECNSCHERVYFRFLSSRLLDDNTKVVYLRCPVCGASATQLQEIEILPAKERKAPRVKFKYSP